MSSDKFIPQARRSFNTSGLTTSYQIVGSLFSAPVQLLRIVNDSDTDIDISYDGVTDHDYLRTTETLVLEIQANSETPFGGAMPQYLGVFVKGAGAGTGFIYVATYGQVVP